MKFNEIKNTIVNTSSKALRCVKKNSPTILKYAGGVGTVGAFIFGCYVSYKKLPDILDKHEDRVSKVKEVEQPAAKDLALAYGKTAVDIVRVYSGPVMLLSFSLASMFKATDILEKRNAELLKKNAALVATCASLNEGFKEYRSRVVEKFGEEVDKQLLSGEKETTVEETVTDAKGKEKVTKKKATVLDPAHDASPYVKYLTKTNVNWHDNDEAVKFVIDSVQRYANDKLISHGHVILNDIYKDLGFDDTQVGMVCGWLLEGEGDGEVKLDYKKVQIPNEYGDWEWAWRIDFNVDGQIYDKMI